MAATAPGPPRPALVAASFSSAVLEHAQTAPVWGRLLLLERLLAWLPLTWLCKVRVPLIHFPYPTGWHKHVFHTQSRVLPSLLLSSSGCEAGRSTTVQPFVLGLGK